MVARIAAAIAAIVVPLSTRNADGGPLLLLASAFTAPCCRLSSPIVRQQRGQQSTSSSGTLTSLSAGKGFGDKPSMPTKQKSSPPVSSSSPASSSSVETTIAPSPSAGEGGEDDAPSSSKGDSAGSELLRQLRSREAEKRDAEIRKLRDLREADALLAEDAGAAVIPERVAQRMGSRMLPFVGIPLFGSFASFIGFWYLATYKDQEFQPAIVATTSIGFLVVGLLVRGGGGDWLVFSNSSVPPLSSHFTYSLPYHQCFARLKKRASPTLC